MSAAKHTPGPWLGDRAAGVGCDVRAANGRKVAACWGLSTSAAARKNTPAYRAECDANAVLISASPEMLEAGRLILAADALADGDPQFDEAMERGIRAMTEAIAKATGSES